MKFTILTYQTNLMKILFICSANKQRSKSAEDHFAQKYKNHEFLSAGTNTKGSKKEIRLTIDD